MAWNCNQGPKVTGIITVSILPQKYFVQRIVRDKYRINVMIPPGHSPATYEPTPREMKALSESILYFRIGPIAFEKAWMDKIASINKAMKIVNTSKGVSLISGSHRHSHEESEEDNNHPRAHLHEGHSNEAEYDHRHGGIDPHIWISSSAVKVQTKNILNAIIETDPENRAFYEKNYLKFVRDIERLQAENEEILKPLRGRKFMVYHPAWSYFARDYGLIQFPIEIEGKNPGPAHLKKIIDTAKKENIRVIFVQKQFDSNSAMVVANEIDGKVITIDPLAPDWLANMKKMALSFKEALTLE